MFKNKTEHKLWLYVIGTMAVIFALWAAIFYPQSLKQSSQNLGNGLTDVTNKFTRALTIFKKSPAPKAANGGDEVEALRERVFGDSIKRVK